MFFSKLQRTESIVLQTLYYLHCTDRKIWNAESGSQVRTEWWEARIVYYAAWSCFSIYWL